MALFRRKKLVDVPAHLTEVALGHLQVHTAESLVIITLGVADVPLLHDALSSPTALSAADKRVVLVPVKDSRLVPAHDPKRGWIIPVTRDVAAEITSTLQAEPGGYELAGLNVAFIVE
ncbi:hypothetical protein NYP18_12040 [Corynebacterium sp. YIM 101645]|uniref:Uncharacterized protein n=1 Tax=Corynebacterium lemuris TaxID=1859292 RepID=A0ABT2G262_9CORY|nr:hypothetical protein [Corynebacterium lemuris]MCS5480382.1 hypothetical protein [Corynebacterium lemuris]